MAVFASVPTRVTRPALTRRMADLLARGGLLVTAGAGYGKTTAIDEALIAWGGPAAWVGVTDRERDRGHLLFALLRALDAAVPGVAGPVLERLAAGAPIDALDVEQRLPAELDALLVEPVALVVDDAERLAGARDALDLLQTLLSARTSRLRVVVASRRALDLGVAKARATGRVHEVTEAELVFSAEECAAVLRGALGREPSGAEVAERMAVSLGWPLGVALGAPAGDDPEHALRAFLVEEILDRLDPALRDAVLDSSAVEELTPPLLEALGLDRDFPATVAGLGLPLRPVPTRPAARAYHPLVREVLRADWHERRDPEARRALLARVARPLAAEGRTREAIAAWLDAGRWDEALEAIVIDAPVLMAATPDAVRAWLGRVPAGSRRAPLARVVHAQLVIAEGRPADAADDLQEALEALGDPRRDATWSGRLVLAECLYFTGRMEELAVLAEGFDAVSDRPAAQAVALWASIGHAALGRADDAGRLADAVRRAGGEDVGVLRTWREAHLLGPSGDVGEILTRIARELEVADRDPYLWRPDLLLPTSIFLLSAQGRIDAALELSDVHLRLTAGRGSRPDIHALSHELRAWLLAQAGRLAEAEASLEASRVALPEAWAAAWLIATEALLAHARGEGGAGQVALRALDAMAGAPVMLGSIGAFSMIPVVGATDPARARAEADRVIARLDGTHPGERGRFYRARALAQRAWARHAGGDPDGAAVDVGAALAEAGDTRVDLLRAEWERLRAPALAALGGGLEPAPLVRALEAALPGELPALSEHPAPAVRIHVAEALARSGQGEAIARLTVLAGDPEAAVAAAAADALERARHRPPARVFTILGGFGLRRGDWPVPAREWERPMAQRLVRLLLVRHREPVSEDELLEALWPDKPAKSARASLQVAVSRARGVLDPPGSQTSAIRAAGGGYRLQLDERDRVDADLFERAARTALGERSAARRPLLERAAALWTGEPLPEDRYADWARPARERLEHRRLEVLHALLDEHLAHGDTGAAVQVAHRVLEADPLHEGAHRALMLAFARAGRRGRALRQYLECRRALVDALGLEPDEETARLQRRILAGEAV